MSITRVTELIYNECRFSLSEPILHKESQEYHGGSFRLNGLKVIYRQAKVTPTKIGQFVTLWKRSDTGITEPYRSSEELDLVVIDTPFNNLLGQFVFPKYVLIDKGIISTDTKGGKRGFRVYPPWDQTTNNQARRTQKWQLAYFLPYNLDEVLDENRVNALYLQQ